MGRLRTCHGASDVCMCSVDFSDAYKTIGLRRISDEASYICFANPMGKGPYMARILAQPFAGRGEPPISEAPRHPSGASPVGFYP